MLEWTSEIPIIIITTTLFYSNKKIIIIINANDVYEFWDSVFK